jgi:hypothetical protein
MRQSSPFSNRAAPKKHFLFENYWLQEHDFKQVATTSWGLLSVQTFSLKDSLSCC